MINIVSYLSILFILSVSWSSLAQLETIKKENSVPQQVIQDEKVLESIEKQKHEAEEDIQATSKVIADTKAKFNKSDSIAEKSLLEYLTALKNHQATVASIKLQIIENTERGISDFSESTLQLIELDKKLTTNPLEVNAIDYQRATLIWRSIVDRAVASLFDQDDTVFPELPSSEIKFSEISSKHERLKNQILEAEKLASNEMEQTKTDIFLQKKSLRNVGVRLLLNSGRTRSRLMGHLISQGKFHIWNFDSNQISDFLREVQIVPYRFLAYFAEKILEFRSISEKGINGWISIAKQIIILIFVFALPFFIFKLFKMFSSYLEKVRSNLFTRSQMNYKKRTTIALWIGRLNPYLPWFFAYIALVLSESLLNGTLLEPLAIFIPYLKFYVIYRSFTLLFVGMLGRVLLSKNLDKLRSRQSHVKSTAKRLSLLFFLEWVFLHATEDVVRRALIFNILFDVIVYVNILLIAIESVKWKNELVALSSQWLNPKILKIITPVDSYLFWMIVSPLLFLGNVGFLSVGALYSFIGKFEFGKQLSSEIFKKRLEDATGDSAALEGKVSKDYSSLFLNDLEVNSSSRVTLSRLPLKVCIELIQSWLKGTTHDDLLLLYGNYGIGKTSLLVSIEAHFKDSLTIKKLAFKEKVTSSQHFFTLLSEAFGADINSGSDFVSFDQSSGKTMLILDDIHNLYLNSPDGLEAYRTLIELANLQLDNIFWCLSSNEKALMHLNGVFGPDHFLGEKVELLSWTDGEIQDLILKRHEKSNMRLHYDRVISVIHKGDILESTSNLEVQFFRLLWGQSRGNPLTAQELWLSAAFQLNNGSIKITVPKFTNSKTFSDLDDNAMLVFATFVKHENLSFDQLSLTCQLAKRDLLKAIKIGEDGLILQKISESRWRIHPKAQYVVHSQLIGRNLIYG